MNYFSIFTRVGFLVLGLSMIASAVSAEQEIDLSWQQVKTEIDFISQNNRLIVIGDREFSVPFNTYIFNAKNQPVALDRLSKGNRVLVYLNRPKNGSRAEIKRIEIIK
ncbi:hypothetical protein N9A71_05865 [Porticoccaceae bacterium]|jgi:hypothetical protein|nr:hypothetical protein [Porticoccaceae bacterium]